MPRKKTIIIGLMIFTGAIAALAVNLFLLDRLFIPDPCYYHAHNGGWLFHLFYDLPANEGYHPVPNIFNIVFTALLGGLAGFGLSILIIRKKKTKTA